MLIQIDFYFSLIPQIITDDSVDIRQCQGWVLIYYFFTSCAILKSLDYSFERYSRTADSYDAMSIFLERKLCCGY